ncbi:MAG: glycosyltransferase family 4 protein [bacterium]
MSRVLLCVNSDVGRGNTIGFRFGKIANELKKNRIYYDIIARANYDNGLTVIVPFYKNYLARSLNAFRIFLFPKFNYRKVEIKLFDYYVLFKLRYFKKKYCLAHFGEPLPRSIEYLKKQGTKVVLDIPIGHVAYAIEQNNKGIKIASEKITRLKCLDQSIEMSDVIIIPSEFVRHTLKIAKYSDITTRMVRFGVDLPDEFHIQDISKRALKKKITFLFVGNVNFRKGVLYLLESWKKANMIDAELILCGRFFKEIKKELHKYNFDNVIFTGFADIKKYMRDAHIFVFPTLLEGSAKAIFEAMSYGLPVITTFNAGSIVKDSDSGFIIPIADSDAMVEKMKFFYNNSQKIVEMGINAYNQVKDFTWNRYASSVFDVYKEFCDQLTEEKI